MNVCLALYDYYCYDGHYYYCFNRELRRNDEQFMCVMPLYSGEWGLLALTVAKVHLEHTGKPLYILTYQSYMDVCVANNEI